MHETPTQQTCIRIRHAALFFFRGIRSFIVFVEMYRVARGFKRPGAVEELIFLGNDFLRKIVALALSWSGEPGKRGKGREENGQLSDNIIKKHTTTITIILLK